MRRKMGESNQTEQTKQWMLCFPFFCLLPSYVALLLPHHVAWALGEEVAPRELLCSSREATPSADDESVGFSLEWCTEPKTP